MGRRKDGNLQLVLMGAGTHSMACLGFGVDKLLASLVASSDGIKCSYIRMVTRAARRYRLVVIASVRQRNKVDQH